MQRRDFVRSAAGAALSVAGLNFKLAHGESGKKFRFVHFTDLHLKPEDGAEQGVLKAVAAVNALSPSPDFVITGGDLVADALAVDFERADMLFKLYQKCMDQLDCPVYHAIGNHDILGWYPKSNVAESHPEYGKKMFAGRLGGGRTWNSFDHKGWHFVILDSLEWDQEEENYMGLICDEQLAWLRSDLAGVDRHTPIAVVTHIPFVSIVEQVRLGANAALNRQIGITNSLEVLELFKDRNLQLVMQGHLHRDEQLRLEGCKFVMSGAICGRWWAGANLATEEGFGVLDVDGADVQYSYHDYGWEVRK
jgi:3',5'-cyclic-AMP phosphodiesterase